MSRGLTNQGMKIPPLTLTLSLREREFPSPSRGGIGWGWVKRAFSDEPS